MNLFSSFKYLFILSFVFNSLMFAQGSLSGVIMDSLSDKPLVGANVFLTGTSLGSASNLEGEFSIPGIPSGKYTVKISYIGYRSKLIPVTIANKPVKLNVVLVPDVIEGEEVVISAQASGQISAINQQRSSNTIINVISEEKIRELPDQNAAESIGRLPGVSILRSGGEANKVILRGLPDRYTSITIDGVKIPPTDATGRGVDLSILSQSSLSGIELFKALTPDEDGDALAGSINLVTKVAPESREIRADLKGGYNGLMNSAKQYDFSLRYGERFFNNLLGVQLIGNLESKIRSNERTNVNYLQNIDKADYNIDDFILEFTDETRKRNGISLLLDYNTPDEGNIRINNVFGLTKREFFWSARDYAKSGSGGIENDGRTSYNYRDREQEIKTFNSSIKGNNNLIGLSLNWGASFAQSDSYYPFDYQLWFAEPNPVSIPPFQTQPEQLISYALNNFTSSPLQWSYYRTQDNLDKERTAFLDVSKNYTLSKLFSGEIKFGGKYKVKDRSNSRSQTYTPYYLFYWRQYERMPDGTIQRKNFTGTSFETWFNSGQPNVALSDFIASGETRDIYNLYSLNPLIDKNRLHEWQDLNKNGVDASGSQLEVFDNPLEKYDDYEITERVAAGYIMNTLNISQKLTIIAGLRVEDEDNDYTAKYMVGAASGFPVPVATLRDTTSSSKQTVWLPNVNISYRPFEFMTIRLAGYKALARPDFSMRLDRYSAGRPSTSGASQVIYVGNPNLKTAQAWNYEVNTSFYGNEIGLISLSAYYKEIKDFFHLLTNFNTEGNEIMRSFGILWDHGFSSDLSSYNLVLPYNAPKPAKVWGFEFEHQINFHFLPGLLKNIVLSYNASFVRSEAVLYKQQTIISRYDTLRNGQLRPVYKNILGEQNYKLEGMPEFFGNVSLGYDIGGFSGRISMFHKSAHDSSFSATGLSDRSILEYTRFDLSLKQQITDIFSIFLNVSNITDARDGFELQSRRWDRALFDQDERYGRTAEFGMTVEL